MQFTLLINQVRSVEWHLNVQQAIVFSFIHSVPTWAEGVKIDGKDFFHVAKTKISKELPIVSDKPNTIFKILKALEDKGLIELATDGRRTLVRITEKGILWNTDHRITDEEIESYHSRRKPYQKADSEPEDTEDSDMEDLVDEVGKKSHVGKKATVGWKKSNGKGGKKATVRLEKNPTDQLISNQLTSDQLTRDQKEYTADESAFDKFWSAGMRKLDKKKAMATFLRQMKRSKMSAEEFGTMLAEDVQERLKRQQFGFSGLHPTTYLNGERWNDELPIHSPDGEYVGGAPAEQFEENEDGSLRL